MLADAVTEVLDKYPVEQKLQQLKETGQRRWQRDDIIWFELVLSHATQGGSWGEQIVVDENDNIDEHRYGSVAFRTLEQIDNEHVEAYLGARLAGNVRMPPTKANRIESNFNRIKQEYGDPLGAKEAFIEREGVTGKMEFLRQFNGIGDKYARNIPMDLYLEEFRDFIAIDSRIEGLLEEAGYQTEHREYEEIEAHLCSVASDVGIEPWELDRTMYNFEKEIGAAL